MKAVINAELVMHDHYIPNAVVLFDDGVITDYGEIWAKRIYEEDYKEIVDEVSDIFAKYTKSASLVDAFNYASYNPLKAIGFCDRGEISIGKRADLIIVDGKMNVEKSISFSSRGKRLI